MTCLAEPRGRKRAKLPQSTAWLQSPCRPSVVSSFLQLKAAFPRPRSKVRAGEGWRRCGTDRRDGTRGDRRRQEWRVRDLLSPSAHALSLPLPSLKPRRLPAVAHSFEPRPSHPDPSVKYCSNYAVCSHRLDCLVGVPEFAEDLRRVLT